jgi:hypothetical protein
MTHPLNCDLGWIQCWSCGGAGDYHDCGEDSCCCAYPDTDERWACGECLGDGGWPCHVCEPGQFQAFMRRAGREGAHA